MFTIQNFHPLKFLLYSPITLTFASIFHDKLENDPRYITNVKFLVFLRLHFTK